MKTGMMIEHDQEPPEPIPEHIKIAALGIVIIILAYGIYTMVM